MTVSELVPSQMLQLKQRYLDEHLLEVEDRTASYNELVNADEIVPDEIILEDYKDYTFVEDDFFEESEPVCSQCADCAYLGDKYSFPLPNELEDTEHGHPLPKRYYCCCGDSPNYQKCVSSTMVVQSCEHFESVDG